MHLHRSTLVPLRCFFLKTSKKSTENKRKCSQTSPSCTFNIRVYGEATPGCFCSGHPGIRKQNIPTNWLIYAYIAKQRLWLSENRWYISDRQIWHLSLLRTIIIKTHMVKCDRVTEDSAITGYVTNPCFPLILLPLFPRLHPAGLPP